MQKGVSTWLATGKMGDENLEQEGDITRNGHLQKSDDMIKITEKER